VRCDDQGGGVLGRGDGRGDRRRGGFGRGRGAGWRACGGAARGKHHGEGEARGQAGAERVTAASAIGRQVGHARGTAAAARRFRPAGTLGRMPSRADAWELLCEWTKTDALRRHGLAVEAAVAWYGEHHYGIAGDELEIWRSAGLLHDFDYERDPEHHPLGGAEELRRRGYRDDVVEAILGHGDHTGIPRTSLLAKVVYACDEMTGFVIAVTYVRPNRSLDEVDLRSV